MSFLVQKSRAEELMVEILKRRKSPMTLGEIVDVILKSEPEVLAGETPRNSMYSIIFRREKRRKESKQPMLFKTTRERRNVLYQLNR
jgi:hypothetical protein